MVLKTSRGGCVCGGEDPFEEATSHFEERVPPPLALARVRVAWGMLRWGQLDEEHDNKQESGEDEDDEEDVGQDAQYEDEAGAGRELLQRRHERVTYWGPYGGQVLRATRTSTSKRAVSPCKKKYLNEKSVESKSQEDVRQEGFAANRDGAVKSRKAPSSLRT